MKAKPAPSEARFAYEGLDRVIHERARLSVLTSLISNPKGLTFGDLKQLCALTDGNLSRHLSVLEREKIVQIVKGHDRNRPQTLCRITPSGRKRYLEYLSTLEQVVLDAAKVTKEETAYHLAARMTPRRLRFFLGIYFALQSTLAIKEMIMDEPSSLPFGINSRSMGMKLIVVCALALLMTIPALFVGGLIRERTERAADVVQEISGHVGGQQTFLGPTLAIPYNIPPQSPSDSAKHGMYLVFPATASACLKTATEERRRSLFKVPVFEADLKLDATFDLSGVPSVSPARRRTRLEPGRSCGRRQRCTRSASRRHAHGGRKDFNAGSRSN